TCHRTPTSGKEEERKALNVSKSEVEKQVTGYTFQGGNSENGSSQSQMDCEEYSAKLKHTTKKPGTLNQVPEIPVVNSFTPLDQAADMQTDDSPTTQNKMHPVMVNIEDQNVKDITNLIGSEFGKRFILKLAPKHLKCTALDNQSYQDLITYLENNEFLQNYPQIDEVTQGGAERVTSS
ncbi:hypothetical protein CDAR_568561, partial [Caerostris darwini]